MKKILVVIMLFLSFSILSIQESRAFMPPPPIIQYGILNSSALANSAALGGLYYTQQGFPQHVAYQFAISDIFNSVTNSNLPPNVIQQTLSFVTSTVFSNLVRTLQQRILFHKNQGDGASDEEDEVPVQQAAPAQKNGDGSEASLYVEGDGTLVVDGEIKYKPEETPDFEKDPKLRGKKVDPKELERALNEREQIMGHLKGYRVF